MRISDNNLPKISIIIPACNSEAVIGVCLDGIKKQNYPKEKIELIIVDNNSVDNTIKIARDYGARIFLVEGCPPKVCIQRNMGVEKATGEYVYILDHDMEMSENLLKNFAKKVLETKGKIDAWYVPERIVGNNVIWNKIRTFERSFYNGTVVDAVRIIKKDKFNADTKYDILLSSGPADWDFDIQLKQIKCRFGILDDSYVNHYEKYINFRKYLSKKGGYVKKDYYQSKWKKLNRVLYDKIVKKQYDAFYRVIGVFVESGKWKKLIKNLHLFLPVFIIRFLVGATYLIKKISRGYIAV